ncbi:MAG: hypothetical protein AB7H70_11505 [Rhodospirillaceae bacterium]
MSKKTPEAAHQLRRLTHLQADALDAASDAEIVEEAKAVFGSVEVAATGARELIRAAISNAGKQRLKQARAAYDAQAKKPTAMVFNLSVECKRTLLKSFAANDSAFNQKLTLAARHGTDTEQDLDGFLEDLLDLGVIDEAGNPK